MSANRTESIVKKKIRAIQYGVGPIGAAIVRLMREKQAIEVIGAIDSDPAKAGRDLGEVVGARGRALGRAGHGRRRGNAGRIRRRGGPFDVFAPARA